MATTAIETIAVILAVIVLVEAVVYFFNKKALFNFAEKYYKNKILLTFVYLILAIVVFTFLWVELTIVQIFAVIAFSVLVMELTLLRYIDPMLKKARKAKMTIVEFLVWLFFIVVSLWVLYAVFYA